jgi:hypothetical protein
MNCDKMGKDDGGESHAVCWLQSFSSTQQTVGVYDTDIGSRQYDNRNLPQVVLEKGGKGIYF